MSKNFRKFPSIEQFRNICKQVQATCKYHDIPKPTLVFGGTVKVHGTNACIGYSKETGVFAQSRSRVITPEKDNAGFALFVEKHRAELEEVLSKLAPEGGFIYVYGEWFGPSVQKGVGVSEIPEKHFGIFETIVVHKNDAEFVTANPSFLNIPTIIDLRPIWNRTITIDFDFPEKAIEEMISLTNEIEAECPVAKHFGISGIGEGVVWKTVWRGQILRHKVKGEKHSVSKVKKLASVDVEKLESIREFVEYAVTNARLEQGIQEVFGIEGDPDIKKMGDFIRWIHNDVIKEEIDVLKENGLERKDYGREMADVARRWFIEKYC